MSLKKNSFHRGPSEPGRLTASATVTRSEARNRRHAAHGSSLIHRRCSSPVVQTSECTQYTLRYRSIHSPSKCQSRSASPSRRRRRRPRYAAVPWTREPAEMPSPSPRSSYSRRARSGPRSYRVSVFIPHTVTRVSSCRAAREQIKESRIARIAPGVSCWITRALVLRFHGFSGDLQGSCARAVGRVVAPPGRRRRVLRDGARQRRDDAMGVRWGCRVSNQIKPIVAFLSSFYMCYMCIPKYLTSSNYTSITY